MYSGVFATSNPAPLTPSKSEVMKTIDSSSRLHPSLNILDKFLESQGYEFRESLHPSLNILDSLHRWCLRMKDQCLHPSLNILDLA